MTTPGEQLGLLMGYDLTTDYGLIGMYWWGYTKCSIRFRHLFDYDYPQTDEVYETV